MRDVYSSCITIQILFRYSLKTLVATSVVSGAIISSALSQSGCKINLSLVGEVMYDVG